MPIDACKGKCIKTNDIQNLPYVTELIIPLMVSSELGDI